MSTPTVVIPTQGGAPPRRQPLRLVLSPSPGRGAVDGAWWPRSQDLGAELVDLVDQAPVRLGRIVHVVYSRPDWTSAPRRVRVAHGAVKTGSYPRDDTHLVLLALANRQVLQLLVVPPDTDPSTARHLMRVACDPANRVTAHDLLTEQRDIEVPEISDEHWTDDGGAWWDPHPTPPSHRRE
ncbi:MAG: DUF5994 family protein [Nocardioides sp.]